MLTSALVFVPRNSCVLTLFSHPNPRRYWRCAILLPLKVVKAVAWDSLSSRARKNCVGGSLAAPRAALRPLLPCFATGHRTERATAEQPVEVPPVWSLFHAGYNQ